jgi:hypothetical protein
MSSLASKVVRRWKWKGGEAERTGIQADSLIFEDSNEFKFLRKESAILGKVSHFLIQGSAAFCYFLKLALS